jgi:predicted O-methyltransferase YrrM
MSNLLSEIDALAGAQRAATFRFAAEFILANPGLIIETGCFRGEPGDGQSTLIFGKLSKEIFEEFHSFEMDAKHIELAKELMVQHAIDSVQFHDGDSVTNLSNFRPSIRFAYFDSYDYVESDPGPCQRHQLAEVGAAYGKFTAPCAILLDDNIPITGGKPLLAAKFLEDRGWQKIGDGYQLLYVLKS